MKKVDKIKEQNRFIGECLGWVVERDKHMSVLDGGSEFYTFYRYKGGKQIDEWDGEEMMRVRPDSVLPFDRDWNWLMEAVEEIQVNDKIQIFANFTEIYDDNGVGVRIYLTDKSSYTYYWYTEFPMKERSTSISVKTKLEATYKAVYDIFKHCSTKMEFK